MARTKIALFGGTFDPVHIGHTTVAARAAEAIGAQKVIFIPAKRSPLKSLSPEAGDSQRLDMLRIVTAENDVFEVTDYELTKPGLSYTLRTINHFEQVYPDAELYWLLGADSIDDLPHWYGIEEVIDRCNVAVMYRDGFARPDFTKFADIWGPDRIAKLRKNVIATPLIPVSSSEIRRRLASGEDVTDMVDEGVAAYIREHGLYGSGK